MKPTFFPSLVFHVAIVLLMMTLLSTNLLAQEAAATGKPRVALLLSGDGKHHDEFNAALKELDWSAERFPSKEGKLSELAGRLDEFDLLIAAPLFNPNESPLSPEELARFRAFVEKGGMIAITDGIYGQVRNWLAAIDPALGGLQEGKCNSSQWFVLGATEDTKPPHPLRMFPSRITEGNSWGHFEALGRDSKWRVVASCSEGHPVSFAQPIGKGVVSLSALRQPSARQLGNYYAYLLLTRAGLDLAAFDLPQPAIGPGVLQLKLAGKGRPSLATLVYEIHSANGEVERFERRIDSETLELPYVFKHRGPVETRLLFKQGEQEALLFSRKAVIPEFLTVRSSNYRGILSTQRRFRDVRFSVELAPADQSHFGGTLQIRVRDSKGSTVASNTRRIPAGTPNWFQEPVNLAPTLPAGKYEVEAFVSHPRLGRLGEAKAALTILAPREAQTIVDEDNTLLVNGKPFFPIGIYHVPPDDYPEVAKLGMNTVQFWVWHGRSGLDRAKEHGLKVLFELNHKGRNIVKEVLGQFQDHPSILMWYGMDEPPEGSYGIAQELLDAYNEFDEQHPVYMVSCRPDIFEEQAAFANVFGVDPYGTAAKADDWVSKAVRAVGNRKPVICVPGSFGEEAPEVLRAAAYAAIANDARGIVWYPWSQAGGGPLGIGLKNHPELQAVVKEVTSELTRLTPALTAVTRVPFRSQDGKAAGIFCAEGNEAYVILVNPTQEKVTAEFAIPVGTIGDGRFVDFFEKEKTQLNVRQGRLRVELEPLATKAFIRKR